MVASGSDAIGPTAHYTGHVWARHGLSHPELDTRQGLLMHTAMAPAMLAVRAAGEQTLDDQLIARHRRIDERLETAICAGRVGQVLEVACGLSPRGWRFTERHPELVYVEADLPAMAERKQSALERIGRPPGHRVAELDALAPSGPRSLASVTDAELDPALGLAIVTEGLLSYLPRGAVHGLWRTFASALAEFPSGLYLSDLHVGEDTPRALTRVAETALGVFVRSGVSVHFPTARSARDALIGAGFARAEVRRVASAVRVLEATP